MTPDLCDKLIKPRKRNIQEIVHKHKNDINKNSGTVERDVSNCSTFSRIGHGRETIHVREHLVGVTYHRDQG